MPRSLTLPSLALVLLGLLLPGLPAQTRAPHFDQTRFEALHWREVGPWRGGRSAAVAGVPGEPDLYYFGACGGGVWKTTDGGRRWDNVSDGFFGGSIGAVAVSEWDPNVVWVGGGEKTVRGNVSHGDGIWRSDDAGKTWRHVGLADSRHVPRIRIHPRDPDRVWAACLGHLFGPSEERGVYRTADGGESWERLLFVSAEVGAVDLALDPTNPRILYAAMWRVKRTPWSLESGGEGSSLWKSTDGGDEWVELTDNPGLPDGPLGIMGITVSPADPENLYAVIEAEEGGVFRSRDGGETWKRTSADRSLRQRAWYYSRIFADPRDAETVYVTNVGFHRSVDGGQSFSRVSTPHSDNHDLWIAPEDPRRMIESNDGGANVSFDGGRSWSPQDNQPTAQIYRVSTDDEFPYRLLGGQQDNSALRIRSRSVRSGSIGERDWEPTAGGESGHVVARPGRPDLVFGGSYGGYLERLDHQSGERRMVHVWPDNPMGWGAGELRYRFQWNFPLFFSPHDPDRIYAAANVLFRSDDGGARWEAISGDLTRADPSTLLPSGGPITGDNTGVEYYATIFAALESPHEAGVLWTGSDDGRLHLSRDAGESWEDVTPPGLLPWMQLNSIEAHPFEPGGLYVAGTRYKSDDFRPYLWRTEDWGRSWTPIVEGIDPAHFTRVIRADPDRRGLLYAGTERGVYVSFDDGESWRPMQLDLPVVPITDLAVKDGDLVAATQGRGFWILDDLSVLHQLGPDIEGGNHLFGPRPGLRAGVRRVEEPRQRGTNPQPGVLFSYWLAEEPAPGIEVTLAIMEADGTPIRAFVREPDPAEGEPVEHPAHLGPDPRRLPAEAGLNRFAWDLRYPPAEGFEGMVLWNRNPRGPRAAPGRYRARLVVGDWSRAMPFWVRTDPRSSATLEDYRAQHRFLIEVRDRLTRIHREIRAIRRARGELAGLVERAGGAQETASVREIAEELRERLGAIEEALYQTKSEGPQDPLNFPIRLDDKLAGLANSVSVGDFPPTAQAVAVRDELFAAVDAELAKLAGIRQRELPELERLAREAGVPAVVLEPPPDRPSVDEERSVKPGINDGYLDIETDVARWVRTFEGESREIFALREGIVEALELAPGMAVADVGAGTGLFLAPLAAGVGPTGRVFAVDIAPKMVGYMDERIREEGLERVETVLCTDRSAELADGSIDLVFTCDTYHHFEYPRSTLASLHRALRPGGRLIVVDLERVAGESREWTLRHVRAGKEEFIVEIEEAGFVFDDEPEIEGMQENYMLRFRRP